METIKKQGFISMLGGRYAMKNWLELASCATILRVPQILMNNEDVIAHKNKKATAYEIQKGIAP